MLWPVGGACYCKLHAGYPQNGKHPETRVKADHKVCVIASRNLLVCGVSALSGPNCWGPKGANLSLIMQVRFSCGVLFLGG